MWYEYINIALQSLKSNKMRATLTMLGIIIGVAAVITMVSLGEGAKRSVQERLQSLGSDIINIRPGSQRFGHVMTAAGSNITLSEKDAERLLELSPFVKNVSPEFSRQAQVKYGNKNWNTTISGTLSQKALVSSLVLERGRFFDEREALESKRVCVLGKTAYTNLFENQDPIGAILRIKNVNFQVIGLLEEKGSTGWRDMDDVIYAPLGAVQKRLFGADFITGIDVQVMDSKQMTQAIVDIEKILRKQHRLRPDQDNDFYIRNNADVVNTFQETSDTFSYLLLSIALVSLLVGGIGIMNIMMVSVTERTREIGIRKALGARRRDVRWQFLIEAMTLSIFGGLLGIFLGLLASYILTRTANWNLAITLYPIVLSFIFAAMVGIIFGMYPAERASRLNPIEALRYE